jgi:hypothetical protein
MQRKWEHKAWCVWKDTACNGQDLGGFHLFGGSEIKRHGLAAGYCGKTVKTSEVLCA